MSKDRNWSNDRMSLFDVTQYKETGRYIFLQNIGIETLTFKHDPTTKVKGIFVMYGSLPQSDYLVKLVKTFPVDIDIVYREVGPRHSYDAENVVFEFRECKVVGKKIYHPVPLSPDLFSEFFINVTLKSDWMKMCLKL